MKPMLAHVWEPHRVTYPCYVQPKFNGVRALYQNGRFQSREEIPWGEKVLAHIAEDLKKQFGEGTVLDGELYRHGWPLQKIAGAVSVARSEPSEDTLGIQYMIFDRVDFNKSFEDRFPYAPGSIEPNFSIAMTKLCPDEPSVNSFYSHMVAQGFEGIMYRLGDCPYTVPKQERDGAAPYDNIATRGRFLSDKNNRTWHLLKRKAWQDGEYEVVSIEEGVGKRQGKVGAFKCGVLGHVAKFFRVGSGLSDHEASHYFLHPELVLGRKIKVKFLTLTEDGIPFNPTFEQLL